MAGKGKTDSELLRSLEGLDNDLLDPNLPEALLLAELNNLGINPKSLAERGTAFVTRAKEDERLAWQVRARQRQSELESRVFNHITGVPKDMPREAILARLDQIRAASLEVGPAIKMAAHKRRPEESTDEELRTLLEEMEALRSIDDGGDE